MQRNNRRAGRLNPRTGAAYTVVEREICPEK